MNPRAWAWFFTVAVAATSVRAQGMFQNLDFESARFSLVTNVVTGVAVSDALPGWSASDGTAHLSTIAVYPAYPVTGGFLSPVDLIASATDSLDGNFSVILGAGGGSPVPAHGTISQTGRVPAGVHSLLFKAALIPGSTLQVSLGGANLSYVALSTQPTYTVYGADISALAGDTAELIFMAATRGAEIDDIQFSPQIVPEPSVLALAGLGFGTLLVFHRQRRSGLPSKGRRRGELAGSPTNHAEAKREFWFLLCKLRKAILCAPAPLQRAMR